MRTKSAKNYGFARITSLAKASFSRKRFFHVLRKRRFHQAVNKKFADCTLNGKREQPRQQAVKPTQKHTSEKRRSERMFRSKQQQQEQRLLKLVNLLFEKLGAKGRD